jgi:NAD(P)-dependent dehydrogenase (short-subunit alcohol dehydrogenase family)
MLSESLRTELAPHGIGVTAICPGVIDTPITRATAYVGVSASEQERRRDRAASMYRRRAYSAERVADAVLDAVLGNKAVVPVSPEAHAARALSRVAPGLLRRLGRLDPL